jgi:hypothetical protein
MTDGEGTPFLVSMKHCMEHKTCPLDLDVRNSEPDVRLRVSDVADCVAVWYVWT